MTDKMKRKYVQTSKKKSLPPETLLLQYLWNTFQFLSCRIFSLEMFFRYIRTNLNSSIVTNEFSDPGSLRLCRIDSGRHMHGLCVSIREKLPNVKNSLFRSHMILSRTFDFPHRTLSVTSFSLIAFLPRTVI